MNRIYAASLSVAAAFVIACSFSYAASPTAKTYQIDEPSFEVVQENGTPAKWSADPSVYAHDLSEAHTGNASLKWSNDNPERYRLCTQKVNVKPGEAVLISVWTKTRNVTNGAAALCMEWQNQEGEWLGGAYAHGTRGTNDWTQIVAQAEVPKEAKEGSVSLSCYGTQGACGTAWFDDVEIRPYIPAFFSAMTTNKYRHQTIGGPVKVFVGLNNRFYNLTIPRPEDELIVSGPALKQPLIVKPSGATTDSLEFTVDSDALPAGKYSACYKTSNPLNNQEEKIECAIIKLDSFPNRKTYIDDNRRFIVDGKPYFPLGFYFGGVKPEELEIYADSKFNCIMPYQPISRESLDLLQSKGISCFYSVKDYYQGLSCSTDEQGRERTTQKINELKDHPAIVAWYINDELPLTMLDKLAGHRDLCEQLDPGRPTWVVLYQYNQIRSYIPSFDVIGTDPYPIPSRPASAAYDWAKSTFEGVFGAHAMIQVPQAFNWAAYKKTTAEKQQNRTPTPEELRGMAWMNIAGGANGLIFYSWFDLWKMAKTVEQGGQALVAEPFEKRWADLKKLGEEISDCFPILLGAEPVAAVCADESSDPAIVSRLFGTDGATWLLLVNTAEEPKEAVYSIPDSAKLGQTKLGGDNTSNAVAKQDGNRLRIVLPALEPRLIEIKTK